MRDDSLLDRACALWGASRIASRDARLAVGKLLNDYAAANLAAADGMNEADRRAAGLSRTGLIALAARRLGLGEGKVRELMHVEGAVAALSDGGEVGGASWSTLRALRVLVAHPPGEISRTRGGGGLTAAQKAGWVAGGDAARPLFRRAISEGWASDEVRSHLARLAGAAGPPPRGPREGPAPGMDLFSLARNGTPRDVADLALQLVNSSADPGAVGRLVRAGLSEAARTGRMEIDD